MSAEIDVKRSLLAWPIERPEQPKPRLPIPVDLRFRSEVANRTIQSMLAEVRLVDVSSPMRLVASAFRARIGNQMNDGLMMMREAALNQEPSHDVQQPQKSASFPRSVPVAGERAKHGGCNQEGAGMTTLSESARSAIRPDFQVHWNAATLECQ